MLLCECIELVLDIGRCKKLLMVKSEEAQFTTEFLVFRGHQRTVVLVLLLDFVDLTLDVVIIGGFFGLAGEV
jgi:hypothetical protein